MPPLQGFVAYASNPPLIGETIEAAINELNRRNPSLAFRTWRATDVAGQFVGSQITHDIASRDAFVADVTVLNFNVTYEIGFAIGRRRRLLLIRHAAFAESEQAKSLGIFDTIGYLPYENSAQLADLLTAADRSSPLEDGITALNHVAPLYVLDARYKTDQVTLLFSRLKKGQAQLSELRSQRAATAFRTRSHQTSAPILWRPGYPTARRPGFKRRTLA